MIQQKVFRVVLVSSLCFSGSVLLAALPKKAPVTKRIHMSPKVDAEQVLMALRLPSENRKEVLAKLGPDSKDTLVKMAFDPKQSLQVRWRSLIALGQMFPKTSKQDILKALKSPVWFMRNAGMIALSFGERKVAIEWAKKLLDDKALVVRTAAVGVLKQVGAVEAESLLWKKLSAKENFKNGQSLWIRKHIVETLAQFARSGQEARFARLLRDEDERLHQPAMRALELMTGKQMGLGENFVQRRDRWVSWAQQHSI
jgi:HEAT repeat protein